MMQAWADYIDVLRASADASQFAQAGENAMRNTMTACQVPLREMMAPGVHPQEGAIAGNNYLKGLGPRKS